MPISSHDLSSEEISEVQLRKNSFLKIVGPCSAETFDQLRQSAQSIQHLNIDYFRAGIWKPRTQPNTFEGVGKKGLPWLRDVGTQFGIKTCTEVAQTTHVEMALEHDINALWLGARTVPSPFAVQSIADALEGINIPIFIKNPINPDLKLWIGAIERIAKSVGLDRIKAIHRGFSTYEASRYRNKPIWQIPIELKRHFPEISMLCDASHIAGAPQYIGEVLQQAINLDYEGMMVESHYKPDSALSDAQQQITGQELSHILSKLEWRSSSVQDPEVHANIEALRYDIDRLDQDLLELLSQRMDVVREIGVYKKDKRVTALQMTRWREVLEDRQNNADPLNLSRIFIEELMLCIHDEALRQQEGIFDHV